MHTYIYMHLVCRHCLFYIDNSNIHHSIYRIVTRPVESVGNPPNGHRPGYLRQWARVDFDSAHGHTSPSMLLCCLYRQPMPWDINLFYTHICIYSFICMYTCIYIKVYFKKDASPIRIWRHCIACLQPSCPSPDILGSDYSCRWENMHGTRTGEIPG